MILGNNYIRIHVTTLMLCSFLILQATSKFTIDERIDLKGKEFVCPRDAEIVFEKDGFVSNGVIVGNNNSIRVINDLSNRSIFENVKIEGEWDVKDVFSHWFVFGDDADANTANMHGLVALTSSDRDNTVYIEKGEYTVSLKYNNRAVLKLKSQTNLIVNGTISLAPNDLTNYQIIDITKCNDILVRGQGKLIGDVASHTGTQGEWGMGISIISSENVTIEGLTIENMWGDGIYVGQVTRLREDYSQNIKIDNVTCSSNRRQGLSLITGKNILIENSFFIDTGTIKLTAPGNGIDIEPNTDNAIVQNITIDHCFFNGNKGRRGDILVYRTGKDSDITISNCNIHTGMTIYKNANGVTLKHNDIRKLTIYNTDTDSNIHLIDNKIDKLEDSKRNLTALMATGGCVLIATIAGILFLNNRINRA